MVKPITIKDDDHNKLKNEKRKDESLATCSKYWWNAISMEELML